MPGTTKLIILTFNLIDFYYYSLVKNELHTSNQILLLLLIINNKFNTIDDR